jgi:hypothetical protein
VLIVGSREDYFKCGFLTRAKKINRRIPANAPDRRIEPRRYGVWHPGSAIETARTARPPSIAEWLKQPGCRKLSRPEGSSANRQMVIALVEIQRDVARVTRSPGLPTCTLPFADLRHQGTPILDHTFRTPVQLCRVTFTAVRVVQKLAVTAGSVRTCFSPCREGSTQTNPKQKRLPVHGFSRVRSHIRAPCNNVFAAVALSSHPTSTHRSSGESAPVNPECVFQ